MSVLNIKVIKGLVPVSGVSVHLIVGGRTAATATTDDQGECRFEASDGVHHELADIIFGNKTQAVVNVKASHLGYEEADSAVIWVRGKTQEVTLQLKEAAHKKGFRR